MNSSIRERIFLHLSNYKSEVKKRRTPYEISQAGIAKVVDGSIGRVSRIIRKMKGEGYVKEKKKYLTNKQNRKRKVYYLTDKGKEKEKEISEKFIDKKITVKTEDGNKEFKASKVIEKFDNINSLLDILVRLKNQDILDLSEEKESDELSFVNRKDQLEKLKNVWDKVKKGKGFTVFIKGKGGIGKTTLVNEFKNSIKIKKFIFITGKAYSQTSDFYLPLKEAFENYDEDVELPMSQVTSEKKLEIEDNSYIEASKNSLFFEFTNQVKELSKEKPLIIFLDDLMWADKATLHLLNYMTKNLSDNPVLILGAYRPELVNDDHVLNAVINRLSRASNFKEIILKPFDWEETREILDSLTSLNNISSEFVDLIYKNSEGNPLYVREFMEHLKEEKKLPPNTSDYPIKKDILEIPPNIEDILLRRIDFDLNKESRRIASIGSVIGEEIPFELLKELTDLTEIELLHSIDELLERKLWSEKDENDSYTFQHILIKEVIYNNNSDIKKKRFHRLVAKNIKEIHKDNINKYYSDIAYHYEKAGDESEAKKYYLKAGKEAERVYAHDDAVDMYKKALKLNEQEKHIEIREKLADVKKMIGDLDKAKKHYQEILEKTDDPLVIGRMRSKLGQIFITQGDYEKAIDITNKGLSNYDGEGTLKCDLLDVKGQVYSKKGKYEKAKKIFSKEKRIAKNVQGKKEIARALYQIGSIELDEGQTDQALKSLEESVEINKEIEDNLALSKSFIALGTTFQKMGDLEKAIEYFERTLQIAEKIDNKLSIIRSLNNMGNIFNIKRENYKALDHYKRGLKNAKKINDKAGKAKINLNMGVVYGSISEFDKALDHFENTLEIGKELNDKPVVTKSYNNIGSIYHRKGKFEKALDFYKNSLDNSREIGNKNSTAESLLNMGSVHNKKGKFNKALEYLKESLKLTKEVGNKRLKIFIFNRMGESYLGLEETDNAKEYLEKALNLSDKLDLVNERAMTFRFNGKLYLKIGKLNDAKKYLNDGLDLIGEVEDNVEKFKIFYELGRLYREQDENEQAKNYLEKSHDKFKELGMNWWTKQCEAELDKID